MDRARERAGRKHPFRITGALAVVGAVILLTAGSCGETAPAPTAIPEPPTPAATASPTLIPTPTQTPEGPTTQLQGMLDQLNALMRPTATIVSSPTPTPEPTSPSIVDGTAVPSGAVEGTPVPTAGTALPAVGTPASPSATPAPTSEAATPTATPDPPTPTPTSVTVVEPDGYLIGGEHGLALAQTTRAESPTHQGWVDITLALAVVRLGPDSSDASQIEIQTASTSICLVGAASPDDCLGVAWGSAEQHPAELRLSQQAGTVQWPRQKVWPLSVVFEMPANATNASLLFGVYRLPLNLEGDPPFMPDDLAAAPVPAAAPDAQPGTGAYFLGHDYGFAITGLTRQASYDLPGWATANLGLTVIRLAGC